MLTKFWSNARGGAVSVMFAAVSLPMVGMVGLAVDYGVWNQTNSELSVAANVAAMTAVKIAANAQLAGDPNASTEGQQAGQQWFLAEIGANSKIGTTGVGLNTGWSPKVTMTVNSTVTASVEYQGTVPSIFGGIFYNIPTYKIYGRADSQITSAPFLNVEILLDNSGSMEIGATDADITALQAITPCGVAQAGQNAPGAFYITGGTPAKPTYSQAAGQSYGAYVISGYDGSAPAPQPAPIPPLLLANYPGRVFPANGNDQGPSCQGTGTSATPSYTTPWGTTAYPLAGPPCAFACHFDTGAGRPKAGAGNDYFALARSTIGSAHPITLRFDLVKHATNQVVAAMQADNISTLNNLNVGLFSFDKTLHRVYPPSTCGTGPSCEAGNDWATAIADVGAPPTTPNTPDTGIQPSVDANGTGDSNFNATFNALQNIMTASGDGTKPTTPRKVLFLVTDGLADYTNTNRANAAIDPANCKTFKDMGYTVYVVFTPYYAVMNGFYIGTDKAIAEPYATGQLATNLQACASGPSDYISATSGDQLDAALASFLKSALSTPARFTF